MINLIYKHDPGLLTTGRRNLVLQSTTQDSMANTIPAFNEFLCENARWQALLDSLLLETSFMKTSLSKVVDDHTDNDFISQAEHFQNIFIETEENTKDIRSDVVKARKLLEQSAGEKTAPQESTLRLQKKLRNEISYLEIKFRELQNAFNKLLESVVN